MQISHIEVRRHPIWQREVHHERHVAGPQGAISPRGRLILATLLVAALIAAFLVTSW